MSRSDKYNILTKQDSDCNSNAPHYQLEHKLVRDTRAIKLSMGMSAAKGRPTQTFVLC